MDGFLDWYCSALALGLGVAAGVPGLPRERGPSVRGRGSSPFVAVATGVIAALWLVWAVFATLVGLAIGVFSFRRLAPAAVPAAALARRRARVHPGRSGTSRRCSRRSSATACAAAPTGRYAGLRILAKD